MGRLLGIDYGERRCGIALSDPSRIIAGALTVLDGLSGKALLREVAALCAEHEVEGVVVGLPLNMDGSRGPMTQAVEAFGESLRRRLGIPVNTWDERLTTRTAEQVLIEGGTSRAKRKQLIDKVAAQVLLQAYLDAQPPAGEAE